MKNKVHGDPLSAWRHLIELGVIEPQGRDEGLEEQILQRLNPKAPSFEDALADAAMGAFTCAFFEALHPFLGMFRDILEFFKKANAYRGPHQWNLRLDDIDMDLSHFEQWLESAQHAGTAEMQIPAVDWQGGWKILSTLRRQPPVEAAVQARETPPPGLPQDVQTWVLDYNRGIYSPLPGSLQPPKCPPSLRISASIAHAALSRILEAGLTREELVQMSREHGFAISEPDALNFWSIAQSETDAWLRTFIISLSAAASLLSESELIETGRELNAITSEFSLKAFNVRLSLSDLEKVLSLPIWKKRHELYSVWVATEIIRALDGHQVELHQRNGRIEFAFRETVVATIHSSPGPFRLISERRSPLEKPQGQHRTGGVQPDHALWTTEKEREVCRMVVEVKHYKKAALRSFLDVFEDYANAFPQGHIYLVNYGPVGRAVYEVSKRNQGRCYAISDLTPSHSKARQELVKAVRKCVGEPIPPPTPWVKETDRKNDTVLAIDISGSMSDTLKSVATAALFRRIVASEHPLQLVAVDTTVRGKWPPGDQGYAALTRLESGGTELGAPVSELLGTAPRVLVLTDKEGLSSLAGLHTTLLHYPELVPLGLTLALCSQISPLA